MSRHQAASELPSWIEATPPAEHAWRHRLCGTLNDGQWLQGAYCGCGLIVLDLAAVSRLRLVAEVFYGGPAFAPVDSGRAVRRPEPGP